jgi:predicted metalloprotease with PDZ domain
LGGIERGGWRLTYVKQRAAFARIEESLEKQVEMRYSLGIVLSADEELLDTIEGSPAALAGSAPGMKLIGVDGRKYTPDALRQRLRLMFESRASLATSLFDKPGRLADAAFISPRTTSLRLGDPPCARS